MERTLNFLRITLVQFAGSLLVIEPRMFSFNSPFGACPTCDGLGQRLTVDLDLVVPDPNKTLNEGAIEPWEPTSSDFTQLY